MSSHREAPEISKDPTADSTDVYAFVSPDKPDMVTLIANYLPLQQPNGGPNFYEFDDDVLYDIKISNKGNGNADITYRFRFTTKIRNPSFLYNTGPIESLDSKNWNRPQTYSLSKIVRGSAERVLASGLTVPPVNVGPRSTPDYAALAASAVHTIDNRKVFAGQRADAFHVDLGSIFDLGGLRPFNENHLLPLQNMDGINAVDPYNVHTLALQIPITELSRNKDKPTDTSVPASVIGVWTTAQRQSARMFDKSKGAYVGTGAWQLISRLGNPLFNEVLVPMTEKDVWNSSAPAGDSKFAKYVTKPELQTLLPALYPGVFPNLKAYTKPRADLAAILLTGIPKGIVGGADSKFSTFTGTTQADMVRLNLAIAPVGRDDSGFSVNGVLGNDLGGFPNGRRIEDDVVAIELKAIAGATIPLVDPDYTPDDTAAKLNDGTELDSSRPSGNLLDTFPYLGLPGSGYQTTQGSTKTSGPAAP